MGQIVAILAITFVVLLFLRVPIAYSLGAASLLALVFGSGLGTDYLVQTMFNANNSFTLLAVPFFILAGDLMLAGGVSNRLVDFVKTMMGGVTGALGIITVVACMIFAAISGSGPATVAAMGGIMIPAMLREKYDTGYACSLAAAAGALGPIIPPSVILVMYGVTVQQSISDLFIGGITPGIVIGLVLIAYNKYVTRKHGWGVVGKKATGKEKLNAFKKSVWALIMPVIILGGIYSGICTPTEAAVVACIYAIIVGFFVYRQLTLRKMYRVFCRSALTLGASVIIISFATAFGRVLTIAQIPQALATLLMTITENKYILLLIINIFLFFVGMIMETLAAVMILAPLLMPVVVEYGVDPIHFGVIMTINLAMGLCTPPVGVNTYIAAQLGGIKIENMIKPLVPVVGLMFITILVISFVEPISMWLVWLLG